MNDARQHGKGRDTHRGPEKQHRLKKRSPGRKEAGLMKKNPSQPPPQHERRHHPRHRHRHGTGQPPLQNIEAKFQAHHEHVKGQPELRDGKQIALGVAPGLGGIPRKKPALPLRQHQSEEGGSEQHPGDHFRHHLRLAQARGDGPDHAADGENDRQLKKKMDGELQVVHRAHRISRSPLRSPSPEYFFRWKLQRFC